MIVSFGAMDVLHGPVRGCVGAAQKSAFTLADDSYMFSVYAIDRDGHEHAYAGGDCATLEEAMECLDELALEGAMESEPDDPFFVRYGITFTDAGAAEIANCVRGRAPV